MPDGRHRGRFDVCLFSVSRRNNLQQAVMQSFAHKAQPSLPESPPRHSAVLPDAQSLPVRVKIALPADRSAESELAAKLPFLIELPALHPLVSGMLLSSLWGCRANRRLTRRLSTAWHQQGA